MAADKADVAVGYKLIGDCLTNMQALLGVSCVLEARRRTPGHAREADIVAHAHMIDHLLDFVEAVPLSKRDVSFEERAHSWAHV